MLSYPLKALLCFSNILNIIIFVALSTLSLPKCDVGISECFAGMTVTVTVTKGVQLQLYSILTCHLFLF